MDSPNHHQKRHLMPLFNKLFSSNSPAIASGAWPAPLWHENIMKPLLPGKWGLCENTTEKTGKEKPLREKLSWQMASSGLCLTQWKAHWSCAKQKEPFAESLESEVKFLVWWANEPRAHRVWNNPFSRLSSFLKRESFLYSLFDSISLALTHYTCVKAQPSINPLLAGNQACFLHAGHITLGLSSLGPHPCKTCWEQSWVMIKATGVWSLLEDCT